MPIFSDKKSSLLALTGCIVFLGVTLTAFNLLTNTATASHNSYEGTVTLDTQDGNTGSNTVDDTGGVYTGGGQVQFRLMHVNYNNQGGSSANFGSALIEVESPDDTDSDYESTYFSTEGEKQTIDGEDVELASVNCSGPGCGSGSGGFYWKMQFGVIDDGGSETCDSSTCDWEDRSCGGSNGGVNCKESEMLQERVCGDSDCDDGGFQCVSDSSCNTNDDPTADNDETSMNLCSTASINIDVLDNDSDPDNDNLRIDSVGNPSGGGTASGVDTDGDGLDDAISYTPSSGPRTAIFRYTVSDGGDGTDTARVDVDVNGTIGSCEGSITVEVEDQNGNPVNMDTIDITYDGGNCKSGSDTNQLSCSPELQDSGAIGTYSVSDSDYDVFDRDKETDAPDNHQGDPTKTELGF